jgi:DNA-binding NtrC family response regulator
MAQKILIIDDDRLVRGSTEETLRRAGYEVTAVAGGQEALAQFQANDFNLVLCDMKMPGMDGMEVLEKIKEINEGVPFIIMTAYGTIESAVDAMHKGAYYFIQKPFSSLDQLELLVKRGLEYGNLTEENKNLKQQLKQRYQYIGKSKAITEIDAIVKSVAEARSTVLITGESGTGKELVARAIHMNSPRCNRPFIKINCAALPESLIESELFGHKKGAFTGALRDTKGKFELASGGTLLLDEIGEMPLTMQAKLLRVLQEREIDKVGGDHPIPVDIRIVATTNRNLKTEIENGNFREDLYFRLNVVPIHLTPLRERTEDITELAGFFVKQFNEENGYRVEGVDTEAIKKLETHPWPGNVRELENVIERAVVFQKAGILGVKHFSLSEIRQEKRESGESIISGVTIAELEKKLIYKTLDSCGNNKTKAADLLGISIRTLRNKLQEYEGKKSV